MLYQNMGTFVLKGGRHWMRIPLSPGDAVTLIGGEGLGPETFQLYLNANMRKPAFLNMQKQRCRSAAQ